MTHAPAKNIFTKEKTINILVKAFLSGLCADFSAIKYMTIETNAKNSKEAREKS